MINKDSLCNAVFNGQSKETYISLLIYASIGLLMSVLVELIKGRKNIKEKGGFSILYWGENNWDRILLSILAIIVGVNFTEDLINIQVSNLGALTMGFVTDKIVEALITFKDKFNLGKFFKRTE